MNKERIAELADKGFITQIENVENLVALSEAELINKGYITQTGIFDADEATEEEVIEEEIIEDEEADASATPGTGDLGDEGFGENLPVVDEGGEDETVTVPGVTEDPAEEEGSF